MGNCERCICALCKQHNGMWCESEKITFFYKYHCQHCSETGKATSESVYKCPEFRSKNNEKTRVFAIENQIDWLLNKNLKGEDECCSM